MRGPTRNGSWRAFTALLLALYAGWLMVPPAAASESPYGQTFLWIAVILIVAKVAGLIERLGQPAVLGELLVGVVLGNLVLAGIEIVEPLKKDALIAFLAQLGVVILLFQVGLETDLAEMRRVGARAFAVAVVGVVVPFVLGAFVIGPWLLPSAGFNSHLFVGATLTATSVGITGRVFRDMGQLQSIEARIILGAAVIDDVLGIVILAVVSSIVREGSVSVGGVLSLIAIATLFLVGAILIGRLVAQPLARALAWISPGVGMKLTLVIALGLLLAWLANAIGLAPIIGAFAAGLVLEPAFLQDFEQPAIVKDLVPYGEQLPAAARSDFARVLHHHREEHYRELIEPLGHFFVPVFFVYTGMQVNLAVLADLNVLGIALALTLVALAGKVVAGLVAGKVNKWLVGWGMAPRGEVGLIFAVVGKELGVVDERMFSVILVMVILTTLFTPPVLSRLLRRHGRARAA